MAAPFAVAGPVPIHDLLRAPQPQRLRLSLIASGPAFRLRAQHIDATAISVLAVGPVA